MTASSPLVNAAQALRFDGVLLDARGPSSYREGHALGAIALDVKRWEPLARSAEGALEYVDVWGAQIGALGIDGRQPVAVYDDGRLTEAARAWFILQWHGIDARVVDGGWPALWAAPGFALDHTERRPKTAFYRRPAGHVPRVGLVTRTQLRNTLRSGGAPRLPPQVLDARTPAEYAGDDLRANARGGHLPGARLLSHTRLLDVADGTLQSPATLHALFGQAGIQPEQPMVTHCDGGGRAALAALAAVVAGHHEVSVYYLSFSDWARDEACPIARSKADAPAH